MVCYLAFSIADGFSFDGFIRVATLFNDNHVFPAVLSIFESLLYLGNVFLSCYCIFLTHYYEPKK